MSKLKIFENFKNHKEDIVCPKCNCIETATVQHTFPWWSYFHICSECGYMITESEWVKYKPEEEKRKYFLIRWLIRWILKVESKESYICFKGICTKPVGDKQKTDGDFMYKLFFPFVYIAQSCGYCCDDYYGEMYFRLFPFVWLEFSYRC